MGRRARLLLVVIVFTAGIVGYAVGVERGRSDVATRDDQLSAQARGCVTNALSRLNVLADNDVEPTEDQVQYLVTTPKECKDLLPEVLFELIETERREQLEQPGTSTSG